jgi:cellulose synthase/poly-beta-1,6-N-acetylglucosamine synthase-like glycosyltransferase
MSQMIDLETADLETLLSDPMVKQLLSLVRRYPQWTISQLVGHLQTRRFNPKSRKKREVLSYKQASIILQRLNLATPMQRAAISSSGLGKFVDYKTADFVTLLSDPYVQELLAVAESHPNWEVYEMVSQICLGKRNYTTTLLQAYKQAEVIFQRLNLATAQTRELRFAAKAEVLKNERSFRTLFPDLLFYLTHKKEYQETLLQSRPQADVLTPEQQVAVPVPQTSLSEPSVSPNLAYTSVQEENFRWFDKFFALTKQFSLVFLGSFLFFFIGAFLLGTLLHAKGVFSLIGMFFSFVSLFCGLLFFLYSLKYYFTIAIVLSVSRQEADGADARSFGKFFSSIFGFSLEIERESKKRERRDSPGLLYNLDSIVLERHPFVSIHVATYNEKRVIDRFLLAATSMSYDNYEIIVADDSTDETIALLEQWKRHPNVKISHRPTRAGYKGAALKEALKKVDPRTEFLLIFDADFIPYPDSIVQFLKYFQHANGSLSPESIRQSSVAAVQGYQWHILNRSENWITRGVRSEYAGSYIMERTGVELYHGLKQISGSVYLLRKDVIDKVGWGTSITEDFELTLKLYEQGFKVLYTPYIQTPAEAVSTVKRLIRQRMRWAEGHSFNVKQYWKSLLQSPLLTRAEKFEFVYLSPYYLQAFFFIVGTFCWFAAEYLFQVRLPFWTETFGWSLVLTNLFALPLMNLIGLFLEESESKDYIGLFSFVVLSYLVAPFQAFAAVKGFLEKEEGPWFRTPKTGRITDSFVPGRFYRFVRGFFGQQTSPSVASNLAAKISPYTSDSAHVPLHPTFATVKSVPQFRNRYKWTGKAVVSLFLVLVVFLNYLTFFVPSAHAAWYNSGYLRKKAITIDHTKVGRVDVDTAHESTSHGGTSITSLSWSHTTGSQSNTLLIVGVALQNETDSVSTVTFNGTTSLSKVPNAQISCSASCRSELWYAVNPPASTTANIVVSITGSATSIVGGAVTLYNVDQTTPLGTAVTNADTGSTATSFSITVPTAANQLVIESVAGGGAGSLGWVPNSSQTSIWSNNTNNDGAGSFFQASSNSTTLAWKDASSDNWADAAVPVNPAALSNFPVLISRTDTDLKTVGNGGLVQNSNGYDIIFTDSTEATKLDHEIESYTATTGQIVMWVRIPTLSATSDTVIYMYFDNSSISTTQANPTGVWDTNYKGVWHMDEASGSLNDSTSNTNTAAKTGTVTYQATGQIYKGVGFGGTTGNNFSVTDNSSINFGTGSFTYGSWVYMTSAPATSSFYDYFYKGGLSSSDTGYALYMNDNPAITGKVVSGTTVASNNGSNLSTGTWYYFVTVVDKTGNLLHVYQNGVDQGTVSISSLGSTTNTKKLYFGTDDGGNSPLNGRMEEVEISGTARASGWIATEYNNQNSPSTFYNVSAIATNTTSPTIEQQMAINDSFISAAGTGKGIVYIDPAVYSGTVSYYFEVDALVSSGTGSVTLSYNGGGNTVVISGITGSTPQRYRSSAFTPSAGEAWVSAMSGTGIEAQGRLIIIQTDSTKISNTQSAYDVGDASSTTSNSYQPISSFGAGKYWKYDASKYDGTVAVYLEATLASGASGKTATLALFQAGSSCSSPSGGIGAISVTGTSSTRARSSDISGSLTSGNIYMTCLKSSSSGTSAIVDNGNVLINQSATGGITKAEIYHTYCSDPSSTSSTTLVDSPTDCFNKYDSSNWAGGTFTYYYSGTMKSSSSSDTVTSQLCYKTSTACDTLVSGSSFTTNSTSLAYVYSSGFSPPTGGVELDAGMKVSNGSDTNTLNSSQLVIDMTSLSVPENLLSFFPLAIFLPKIVAIIRRKKKFAVASVPVSSSIFYFQLTKDQSRFSLKKVWDYMLQVCFGKRVHE